MRHRPGVTYCGPRLCEDCDADRLTRCWQRRAELGMRLRVVRYLGTDQRLGAGYIVALLGADVWQRRAFGTGQGLVWADAVEPILGSGTT